MASADETSDKVSEVENDKRAAESQSSYTEENEPLEQDDDRRGFHGSDSNENLNRNRGNNNNRRSFRGRGRGGRGHFKPHPRGGQHGSTDDVHPEEYSHPKSRGHHQGYNQGFNQGYNQGYQKSRGAKYLTVSATSSSRNVQIGNGDQLHIKVDLSQSSSSTTTSAAPSGHHQNKQNNHHHQQRLSTNENEADNSRSQDYRSHGRNNKSSELKLISTSEGNRQESHHDNPRYDHRHHNNPPSRGFDHQRRNFRPPRWGGNGRWQRGFIPPRDHGEFRGNDEPFRGSRGFRPPRGGRVFRRRGQGRGRGSFRQGEDEGSSHTTDREVFPRDNLEHERQEQEDARENNSENFEGGGDYQEGEEGGGYAEDEAFHDTTDDTAHIGENPDVHEKSCEDREEVTADSTLETDKSKSQSDEIDTKLADSLASAVTLGKAEESKEEEKIPKRNLLPDNAVEATVSAPEAKSPAISADDAQTSSKEDVSPKKEQVNSSEDNTVSDSPPSSNDSRDATESLNKEGIQNVKVKEDDASTNQE